MTCVRTVLTVRKIPRFKSSSRIPACRSYPMYPWLMAEHTDIGADVYSSCLFANSFIAVCIIPTWGALLWVIAT